MRVLAIDHVQIAMPEGSEDRARGFYGEILGMKEIPKPQALAGRGGCWFASGAAQVHLGVEEGFRPARKAHPALLVEGLDEVLAKCQAAGLPTRPDAEIDGRRRVHVFDPFGNRLELMESSHG
ncbi:MAG: glyoxalase [Acidobacteria bacterium Pan2503]|uniref:Glyoxalase n=1 Tax=Candidatus Acidiferrum panamense TaxID=2741543 RepID=A0A7V8SXV5_9BACT|nr:glyoxalase [Candidatus Acidoferrum panamensis]